MIMSHIEIHRDISVIPNDIKVIPRKNCYFFIILCKQVAKYHHDTGCCDTSAKNSKFNFHINIG